jgi:uncharacterized protein (TIGR02266 family)
MRLVKREDSGERRRSERIPIELWVEQVRGSELYFQRSANLSTGGLFIERTVPHPVGTLVTLQFTLPGEVDPIKVRGEIVSAQGSELGMGVKFIDVDPATQQRITRFVEARK